MQSSTKQIKIFQSIDIHAHILNGVDHGSSSLKKTLELLNDAKKAKILDIVCASHYHYNDFEYNKSFKYIKSKAKNLGINIYKGNEINLDENTLEELTSKRINTINDSNYILVELKRHTEFNFKTIKNLLEGLIEEGYLIIIVHPELIRNAFNRKKELKILKELGIYFQINAGSFFLGAKYRRYIKRMLKLNYVDFVASDTHSFRNAYKKDFLEFQKFVIKKYGLDIAKKIYYYNPLKVLENKKI